mgnify:CR=1 FL=1
MRSVVVGVGNPILGDDAIGLQIAKRLKGRVNADVKETAAGGMELAEEIANYDLAIIIDSVRGTDAGKVEEIDIREYGGSAVGHDVDFPTAYKTLEKYVKMPEVRILGVSIGKVELGAGLSDRVTDVIRPVSRKVKKILEKKADAAFVH